MTLELRLKNGTQKKLKELQVSRDHSLKELLK
jgi:hypothetical protein